MHKRIKKATYKNIYTIDWLANTNNCFSCSLFSLLYMGPRLFTTHDLLVFSTHETSFGSPAWPSRLFPLHDTKDHVFFTTRDQVCFHYVIPRLLLLHETTLVFTTRDPVCFPYSRQSLFSIHETTFASPTWDLVCFPHMTSYMRPRLFSTQI